jgi:predicted secreted hydrolase
MVGWDWFSMQLDNGMELMVYQLRHEDGRIDPHSSATLVYRDGRTEVFRRDMVEVVALERWRSPHSGTSYPSGWQVRVPEVDLHLRLTPTFADQELITRNSTRVVYWEGSVRIEGRYDNQSMRGMGYVELVGYKTKVDL